MPGTAYVLKLVGVRDGVSYELEGSYGRSISGVPMGVRLPSNAKVDDKVIFELNEGFTIVSK
jgi:hypothetical protein